MMDAIKAEIETITNQLGVAGFATRTRTARARRLYARLVELQTLLAEIEE